MSGHHEKFIEELRFLTSMSYVGSGLSAGLLGFVMKRKTWSPAGQTIIWLFPACCAAVTGVLFLLLILLAWFASLSTNFGPGPLVPSGPVLALGAAVFSLPVALAYCLIAGVPWRAKRAD